MSDYCICRPEESRLRSRWDLGDLMKKLKAEFKHYQLNDPRTWPCLSCDFQYSPQHDDNSIKSPPFGVAYNVSRMKYYMSSSHIDLGSNTKWSSKGNGKINWRFRFYPYNFTRDGELRENVGMTKTDFDFWMEYVNGPDWNVPERKFVRYKALSDHGRDGYSIPTHKKDLEPAKVGTTGKPVSTASVQEEGHIANSSSTYNRIMQVLSEKKADSKDAAALEDELDSIRAQFRQVKELLTAEKEENKRLRDLETSLTAGITHARNDVATARIRHEQEINKERQERETDKKTHDQLLKSAKKKTDEAVKEAQLLKTVTEERDRALKEMSEYKQQMENIWTEIQNVQRTGSSKRKAKVHSRDGSDGKRTKV